MLERLDLTQGTDIWLDTRKNYITASEAGMLFGWLVSGIDQYYKKNIHNYTRQKQEKEEFSDFQRAMFRRGHILEEVIYQKLKSKGLKLDRSPVFLFDKWLLLSLDIGELDEDGKIKTIYEVKNTEHLNSFIKYEKYEHKNYYQLALQKIIVGAKDAFMIVHNSEINHTEYFQLEDDSFYVQEVKKHLNTLKNLYFKNFKKGKELFSTDPADIDETLVELVNKKLSIKDQVKFLKEEELNLNEAIVKILDQKDEDDIVLDIHGFNYKVSNQNYEVETKDIKDGVDQQSVFNYKTTTKTRLVVKLLK